MTIILLDGAIKVLVLAVLLAACYAVFHKLLAKHLASRKLGLKRNSQAQIEFEVRSATRAILTYALLFLATSVLVTLLPPKLYDSVEEFGWGYLAMSLVVMTILHDAYFYCTHRLLHHPRLFRRIHLEHHRFRNPTPIGTLALHPLEVGVHFLPLVFFLYAFPVHSGAFLGWILAMTLINVLGHLGYELFPRDSWAKSGVLRLLNTATDHDDHHRLSRCNFGYCFSIWDRMAGTHLESQASRESSNGMEAPHA